MSLSINQKIAHIILAAGASSRMGGIPKQLLPWKHTSLISWEIEKSLPLENVCTYVILGANSRLIREEISEFEIPVIYNENWESGIGSSISLGTRYIIDTNLHFESVLITLVDQPMIDNEHLMSLIKLSVENPTKIIATDMGNMLGVPAIFPKTFFKKLVTLQEDYGARYIINNYRDVVLSIKGLNKTDDIDTMDQYQVLKQREQRNDFI